MIENMIESMMNIMMKKILGEFISYKLFEKFVDLVESQKEFNQYLKINAIPIIGYHEIST